MRVSTWKKQRGRGKQRLTAVGEVIVRRWNGIGAEQVGKEVQIEFNANGANVELAFSMSEAEQFARSIFSAAGWKMEATK
jgi:hypothetical protein